MKALPNYWYPAGVFLMLLGCRSPSHWRWSGGLLPALLPALGAWMPEDRASGWRLITPILYFCAGILWVSREAEAKVPLSRRILSGHVIFCKTSRRSCSPLAIWQRHLPHWFPNVPASAIFMGIGWLPEIFEMEADRKRTGKGPS